MSNAGCTPVASSATPAVLSAATIPVLAILGLVLAAACMGLGPIFVRLSGISADASAFWRVALSAPAFMIAALIMTRRDAQKPDRDAARPRRRPGLLILAGVLFAADLVFAHLAIGMTTVANAILLNNLAPLFVGLLGLAGFATRPGKRFWIGMAVALIGGYCLFSASTSGSGSVIGDIMALIAAAFYGVYFVVIAKLRRDHTALEIMLWSTIVTALSIGLLMLVRGEIDLPQATAGWLALLGLAYVSHIGGQGMVSVCFKRVDEATGSMILLCQPFMSAILSAVILGEVLNVYHALGAVFIVIALLIATGKRRRSVI
ncbi:MAG: DMT family transporter [Pseudomonadota bacterium]